MKRWHLVLGVVIFISMVVCVALAPGMVRNARSANAAATPTALPTKADVPTREPTSTPTREPTTEPTVTPKPTLSASDKVSPPAGMIDAWHGRHGRGNAEGFNIEYIVRLPKSYNGTLEFWACIGIDGKCDEWGNDSLKGVEPERTWREGRPSFPKASWLDSLGNVVWEDDVGGKPGGQKWTMEISNSVPKEYDLLMEKGHVVDLPVFYDAGMTKQVPMVYIIRWMLTSSFPF